MRYKIFTILCVFVLSVFWVNGITNFIEWLSYQSTLLRSLFYSCLMAPICEELLFRHGPFQALKAINFRSEALRLKFTIITALFSSVIFGLMHGHGWNSVLIQGVLGLGFCFVYVKNNYSYWSVVILHALWNLFYTLRVI